MKNKLNLQILPDNKIVKVSQNKTLLENLQALKVPVDSSCGGMGSCGTCRVFVESSLAQVGDRNEIEAEFAVERGFEKNERLACQIHPVENMIIRYKKD